MPIDFHNHDHKHSYATREADKSWIQAIGDMLELEAIQQAVDIGCGGGIYCKALVAMGIPHVTGVDFSHAMIDTARLNCKEYRQIQFQVGNAYDTGLAQGAFDFILERGLIHHLDNLLSCFQEAHRILKDSGTLIIQDRTPSDCTLEGSSNHIRGYFISLYPHLREIEIQRRYPGEKVFQALRAAGFNRIEEIKIWEIRKTYPSTAELFQDIRLRTGRSILHELNDDEIEKLIGHLDIQLSGMENMIEKDRWTIWKAIKG